MLYEYKTIIDENGNIIDKKVLFIDGVAQHFTLKKEYIELNEYAGEYIKPRYNIESNKWVESATEEEIQAWQEENKTQENMQVTEEQQLLSTVLLENAEIKEQLKKQQELSSNLMLQIAKLKGGNVSV